MFVTGQCSHEDSETSCDTEYYIMRNTGRTRFAVVVQRELGKSGEGEGAG